MTISIGVGSEIIRNNFIYSSSIDSVTPVCGLIGFMLGYYIAKSQTKWKYYQKERINMLGAMLLMLLLYLQLSYYYRNISFISMMVAFGLGFIFYFCDPDEKYEKVKICAIIFLILVIGGAAVCLFFSADPPLITTWVNLTTKWEKWCIFILFNNFVFLKKDHKTYKLSLVLLKYLIIKEIVAFIFRIYTFWCCFFAEKSRTG